MSTHYTSSEAPLVRIIQWKRVVFEILIPLFLVISTISAFVDGVPYAHYVMGTTWIYIVLLVGKTSGAPRALQVHAGMGCLYFFASGLISMYMGVAFAPLSSALTVAVVFGLCAIMVQVHYRLERLEAPGKSGRAAEFPGIYRITCKPNGMQYIGMTERPIKARWEDHLSNLNAQRHHNPRLQLDWNTYRPELFKWEVLEVVTDPVWVRDRERAWQDKDYDSTKRYNPPNLPPRIVKTRRPVMKRKSRA